VGAVSSGTLISTEGGGRTIRDVVGRSRGNGHSLGNPGCVVELLQLVADIFFDVLEGRRRKAGAKLRAVR